MIPNSPTQQTIKSPAGTLRHLKSIFKALSGNLSYGIPTGSLDSTGCYSQFDSDNMNNTIIRIGANGTTNGTYQFDATGAVTINHGLQRQPIGFKILDKDQPCDVFRTATPDANFIKLKCSVTNANVTVEIF